MVYYHLATERQDSVNPTVEMRFRMLDRIVELQSGEYITAVKQLRPDEEYLQDHFPRFPVMPGVLMLEAMFQASMWLVRCSEDFSHSVVLLREARNIKFADFVVPGQTLTVNAHIQKQEDDTTRLKAQGTVNGSVAVSGRLILESFNLSDRYPEQGTLDLFSRREVRREFERLYQPAN